MTVPIFAADYPKDCLGTVQRPCGGSRTRPAARSDFKGATTSVGAMALGKAAATIEHAPDLQAMAAAIGILDQQVVRTRLAIANMLPTNLPGLRPV